MALCENKSVPRVSFEAASLPLGRRGPINRRIRHAPVTITPLARRSGASAMTGRGRNKNAPRNQIAGLDIHRSGVSKIEARIVFVDDRTLLYLAEVLKVGGAGALSKAGAGYRLHEFKEPLGKTRF